MINQKTIKDTTIEGFENAIEDTLKKGIYHPLYDLIFSKWRATKDFNFKTQKVECNSMTRMSIMFGGFM